jgi:hypothetical protein
VEFGVQIAYWTSGAWPGLSENITLEAGSVEVVGNAPMARGPHRPIVVRARESWESLSHLGWGIRLPAHARLLHA